MKSSLFCWFALLIAGLPLAGCAVLTPSQVKQVNTYAKATAEYSMYPGELIGKYAKTKSAINLLDIGTKSAAQVYSAAESETAARKAFLEQRDKLNLSIQIIKTYADALEVLSAPSYLEDISKNATLLGDNLDKLTTEYNANHGGSLPTGLGKLVSESIVLLGNRIVLIKQAAAVKKFVAAGTPLVDQVVASIQGPLRTTVEAVWLPTLKRDLVRQHEILMSDFLSAQVKPSPTADTRLLLQQNRAYFAYQLGNDALALAEDIELMRIQSQQLYASIGGIAKAQAALQADLMKKKKLKQDAQQLVDLYQSLTKIRQTYKELNNEK